jgi:hypothetical protein
MIHKSWPTLLLALLTACSGQIGLNPGGQNPGPGTQSYEPCTDYRLCCPEAEVRCEGNVDTGLVCTCDGLWDCDQNKEKCEQKKPTPPGGGTWDCSWSEFTYVCKGGGSKSNPPGGSAWDCTWNQGEKRWICKTEPPNPSNKPSGTSVWKCAPDNSRDKLKCERGKTPEPPIGGGKTDAGVPKPDNGPGIKPPPTGSGDWKCTKNAQGKDVCTKSGGLPPGGGDWNCHLTEFGLWVCIGENVPGNPGGGGGWDCEKKTQGSESYWRCTKPNKPGDDTPPGGGTWACEKKSEFGTKCEKTDKPPQPPGLYPKPGEICTPGVKRWCDGLQYCGWGQMTCKPDGTWPTKIHNGKQVYDCTEMANGARPNTKCACYHFYYNGDCCERPDCIVPQDKPGGQICGKSGGKLCDFCNPQKPECNEAGGKCVVTNKGEAFCGKGCSGGSPCPSGYSCRTLTSRTGISYQCIPSDASCYY